MFFHEVSKFSFEQYTFLRFIFISSSIVFSWFLFVSIYTLWFYSDISSLITSFMHISIVWLLWFILFSFVEDWSIANFHKNMSKAHAQKTLFVPNYNHFYNEQMKNYLQTKKTINKKKV
jgi:hypothetical protein